MLAQTSFVLSCRDFRRTLSGVRLFRYLQQAPRNLALGPYRVAARRTNSIMRTASKNGSRQCDTISGTAGVSGLPTDDIGGKSSGHKGTTSTDCTPIEELHRLACRLQRDTYVDPLTGYQVITEYAHLRRGKCCGNSCRHCPYDHINVKRKKK